MAVVGGGRMPIGGRRDGVLVLDFWATWCLPCRQALPHLQRLWEAERGRGLEVVAINVLEPVPAAVAYWEELGLGLPIGIFQQVMQPELYKEILPTTLVADRWGRLRGRWDGYEPGYEREVARLVRLLLDESEPPSRAVLSLIEGVGAIEVSTTRELASRIDGLAILAPHDGGSPTVLASSGRLRTTYDLTGRTVESAPAAVAFAVVRAGPEAVAAFRPGGASVALRASGAREERSVEVGDAVFDAAWRSGERGPSLAIAGRDALRSLDLDERAPERLGELPGAIALDARGEELVALGLDGRIRWIDAALRVVAEGAAPAGAFRIRAAESTGRDVIVASEAVVGLERGRFFPGDGDQIAAATADGALVIVDAADGRARLRARRDGIAAIAAADLDADGLAELVVAGEREWFVLGAAGRPLDAATRAP